MSIGSTTNRSLESTRLAEEKRLRIRAWPARAKVLGALLLVAGAALVPVVAGASPARKTGGSARAAAPVQGLHVSGHQIVNAGGKTVRLTGFNNSGAEYACEEGWGIFDTPQTTMTRAIVAAMATWAGANAVRVPVNEQCWLGGPGIKPAYAGASYQRAIERYVSLLNAYGFAVILDLAGTAPGTEMPAHQEAMPDSHSVAFWRSAATAFGRNTSVVFDLFNEPWPGNDADTAAAWSCWRNGGCTQVSQNGGEAYRASGMQQLVSAVRGTGARNVVIAEGIQYAETVDQWLKYRPSDPTGNLIASVHVYSFNSCSSVRCYNGAMKALAAHVPLLIGELGPNLTQPYTQALDDHCPAAGIGRTPFDSTLLSWAARNKVSWLAWSWNPWGDCWSLVRDFAGAPTSPYGVIIKSALAAQRRKAVP
jgi:endoglucanase